MSLVLALESATKNCSVAVIESGNIIAIVEEFSESFSHAEKLTVFIEKALKQANINPAQLDAIMVDKGPGSYTGLRIGVSTAKGLSYGLNVPLLSIGSLETMYRQVVNEHPGYDYYIPLLDARRMEVYAQVYDHQGKVIEPVHAKIIDNQSFLAYHNKKVLLIGDGAAKCKEVIPFTNAIFIDNIHPSTSGMNTVIEEKLRTNDIEDSAYFEPFYLKDFIAGKPKKML